jgi:four helix bundle protein
MNDNERQIRSFEDLEAWKYCRQLRMKFEQLVKDFPVEERYKLVDQIVRAARSTHDNIAEGYGRFHYQENIQFCRVSRGSLYELINHLYTCIDNNYTNQITFDMMKDECFSGLKLLNGYIRFLKLQKDKSKE